MVADRVEVTSRKAGSEEALTWASDGAGQFTLAPATRETAGTDIVLHIKADADEYLEPMRLETIVRKWADHITAADHRRARRQGPAGQRGHRALAQAAKPRSPSSRTTSSTATSAIIFDKPWATLHWRAEGTLEFSALLFIPGMKPFEPVDGERDSRVRLHVRRMFITDKAELLPTWLRFVQGVVDTEDLPLNVSREMLQSTPVLGRIRKALTGRVLSELKTRAKDAEDYAKFWENFGSVPEGRHLGGLRAPRRDRAAAALPVLDAGGLDVAARLRVAHEGRPGHDLLPRRRRCRGAEALAPARRLPRQGHRGAAAVRPDRRVLAGAAGQLRGQVAAQRHPGSRPSPSKDADAPDISRCWPR